jgi:hypothetical protein
VPKILDRRVNSLPEFFDVARDLGATSPTWRLWFRGVHDATYSLVPRLYRGGGDAAELLARERDMLDEFRSRSRPLLEGNVYSDWERLFVMQHYGVPTRLLDWSENAFFALYFALAAAERDRAPDAAVWVLDPARWNPADRRPARRLRIPRVDDLPRSWRARHRDPHRSRAAVTRSAGRNAPEPFI